MPSGLANERRSDSKLAAARANGAVLFAAALVLCAFSTNAGASARQRDEAFGVDRSAVQNEVETIPAAGRIGFAASRSAILVNIDRSTVEIASETLALGIKGADDLVHPMPRRNMSATSITGIASTYNPCRSPSGGGTTASGEAYSAEAWTAAIRIDLRSSFAGVRYGRNYKPVFALVVAGEKSAIVRINDVGPLRPGRVIDLNDRAMRYFDNTLNQGVLGAVQVIALQGQHWRPGALETGPAVSMAGDFPHEPIH